MFQKIKEFVTWFTSKKVRAAINAGASYEEVSAIVRDEMAKSHKKEKTAQERPFQKRLNK